MYAYVFLCVCVCSCVYVLTTNIFLCTSDFLQLFVYKQIIGYHSVFNLFLVAFIAVSPVLCLILRHLGLNEFFGFEMLKTCASECLLETLVSCVVLMAHSTGH